MRRKDLADGKTERPNPARNGENRAKTQENGQKRWFFGEKREFRLATPDTRLSGRGGGREMAGFGRKLGVGCRKGFRVRGSGFRSGFRKRELRGQRAEGRLNSRELEQPEQPRAGTAESRNSRETEQPSQGRKWCVFVKKREKMRKMAQKWPKRAKNGGFGADLGRKTPNGWSNAGGVIFRGRICCGCG